jgi:hypothetical protein
MAEHWWVPEVRTQPGWATTAPQFRQPQPSVSMLLHMGPSASCTCHQACHTACHLLAWCQATLLCSVTCWHSQCSLQVAGLHTPVHWEPAVHRAEECTTQPHESTGLWPAPRAARLQRSRTAPGTASQEGGTCAQASMPAGQNIPHVTLQALHHCPAPALSSSVLHTQSNTDRS